MKLIEHEPLAKHTSWRIGGPARYYIEAPLPEDLAEAVDFAWQRDLPVFVLGGGTNLLAQDAGFAGVIIRYMARGFMLWETGDDTAVLNVGAAAAVAGIVRRISKQGWGGLEWAEGLPGTFGGAVFGNAGCYGGDIARVLSHASLWINGRSEDWDAAGFAFDYRTSDLKRTRQHPPQVGTIPPVVTAVNLRLHRADPAELATKMTEIAATRKSKTPWGRSCGSVFKNPPAVAGEPARSAGQLIDMAGLKGTRVGAAEISQKHGNYIVNRGDATSDDVLRLIDLARATVQREFDIELALEVQVL
jgi:UDP-N-acetylmuramate dehydrogenase